MAGRNEPIASAACSSGTKPSVDLPHERALSGAYPVA